MCSTLNLRASMSMRSYTVLWFAQREVCVATRHCGGGRTVHNKYDEPTRIMCVPAYFYICMRLGGSAADA